MPKMRIWLWLALLCFTLPLLAEGDKDFSDHREIWVSGEEEFIRAIAPNTTIHLYSQMLDQLTFSGQYSDLNPEYVSFEPVFDGVQLVIQNVHSFSIIGDPDTRSRILAQPSYANVLTFKNSEELTLLNLDCGHAEEGYCTGGVLSFENCHGIRIANCDLWGCGTEGITLSESSWLTCADTTIRDCSYSILSLYNSYGAEFSNCVMRNNREFSLINVAECREVKFKNCVIYDNSAANDWGSGYLVNASKSEILFSECAIFNNNVNDLMNSPDGIRYEYCTVFGNKNWGSSPSYEEGREDDSSQEEEYYYDEEW